MLVADNPSTEAGLEGATQFADNLVQLIEDAPANSSNALWQGLRADIGSVANYFPQATITPGGIEFSGMKLPAPGLENTLSQLQQVLPGLGDGLSSLMQSALQMPGPLGFLSALFQFFSALFTSLLSAAFDPNFMAQVAQSALDLKKMMLKAS